MPAPLYARYVPPKKGNEPVEHTQAQLTTEQSSPNNQLYARYVPPKKSKPAIAEAQSPFIVPVDTQPPRSVVFATDDSTSNNKKRKREDTAATSTEKDKKPKNKEKKHKTRSLEVVRNDQEVDADTFPQTQPSSWVQDEDNIVNGHEETTRGDEVDVNSIFTKYSVTGGAKRTNGSSNEYVPNGIPDGAEDDEYDPAAGAEAVFAKYRKSLTLSQKRQKKEVAAGDPKEKSPEPELHDLVPMPQPEKTARVPYKATFSSLPSWISNPRAVQADATLPFSELNLNAKVAETLSRKNFTNALAVQTAVLPLLLPGRENYRGDICVSAPTGSGKTMSYVLPMVESMQDKARTRLRGLIVVPTRELVTQAREVAEMCATGTGVRIGTAVGSVALSTEQVNLVKRGQKYDPEARIALDEEARRRIMLGYDKDDELLKDIVDLLPGHVPEYSSNVAILICTPGRLVDHMRSTPGFTIEDVEWLIIDEADRLLDSNFQDWVDIVLPALDVRKEQDPRVKVLASLKEKVEAKRVQKVVLSATMTRDLSKLASLKLNRPTLVAVVEPEKAQSGRSGEEKPQDGHAAILPVTLKESAIPVADGSEKPLYLLQLLEHHLRMNPGRHEESAPQTALIFCANDDNATRLERLLRLLASSLESRTAVLTKSTTASSRRRILNSFGKPGGTTLVISTDRTSRGLDVENLSYVVNYDIPPSVTSYIHRVGRTARAGKDGEAWTLVTDTEARWFWRTIAKGDEIKRSDRTVERVRLGEADEALKESYQEALDKLGDAVKGR